MLTETFPRVAEKVSRLKCVKTLKKFSVTIRQKAGLVLRKPVDKAIQIQIVPESTAE